MNPLVAPTSRMMEISSRRAKMARRIAAPMISAATAANAPPTTRADAAQQVDLFKPVLAVTNVFDEGVGPQGRGNGVDRIRGALARLQGHLDGGGKRVAVQIHEDRLEVTELHPCQLQSLTARDVDDVPHVGESLQLGVERVDLIVANVVAQVAYHLDP
jgi:hypothetical protein